MCKFNFSKSPLSVSAGLMALCGLLVAWYPQDAQSQQCVVATTGALLITGPYAAQPTLIHVGETATITLAEVGNPASAPSPAIPNCTWTNLKAWVVYPNNSFAEFVDQTGAITPPNTFFLCPGGGGCLGFPTTYVVQASDVGAGLSFATNWPPGGSSAFTLGGIPGAVQFLMAGAAGTTSGGGTARPQVSTSLTVINPCIGVTKNCVNSCTPYGQPIAFSGIVTNCGDTTLFNITLTDTPDATITNATTTSSGRTYDGTLQVGESLVYGGTYTPSGTGTALCGPLADTIQAVGADITGFTVTNTASATCLVCNNPCIQVSKNCGPSVIDLAAGSYQVSGLVTNCGNVPLTNVVVVDTITNGNGVVSTVSIPIGFLDIGGSAPIPPQTINLTVCGPSSDFFTATAAGECGGAVTNISATCVTLVTNTACIQVTKVCGPASIDLSAGSYTVSGSVSNCGTAALTGVAVVDTITNANGTVDTITITLGTLPAHTATNIALQTINLSTCGTISDFFTATGTGPCGPASATSGTCVTVVTNAACVQVTKNCGPPLLDLATGSYSVSGSVTNCSTVALTNVVVVDTITNASGVVFTIPINIGTVAAHTAVAIPAQTITVTNCGPSSDFFTVTAEGPCGPASATSATCVTLVTNTACIQVSKVCGPATIDLAAGSYTVSGSVTNCGTAALANVSVVDTITNADGTVDTITINIGTVPAHSSAAIPPQIINLSTCGTISDFFTATGTGPCGPASATSGTCVTVVTNAACVQVTKNCGPPLLDLATGSYTVSGTVTNCSTVALTNVVVVDTITNASGVVFTIPINIGTVAAHTAVAIPAQTITVTNCGPSSDFFTVTAEGPCGPASATSATCVTLVTNTACIQVSKVCGPATIDLAAGSYTVSGSVSNCGTADLTGVVVTDTITNANGTVDTISITIGNLAAHTAAPITPQTINLTSCGLVSDFFTAIGNGPCGPASATSATCTTLVTNATCITVGKVCGPATIDLSAGSYQVSGGVTNCGTAALTGVTLLDVVTDPQGHTTTNVVSTGGSLAAGASAPVGPITIPVTLCGDYVDYLIAIGIGPCGSVTNRSPQTCTTTVRCPLPCINVSKGIACAPISGAVCNGTLTYLSSETGVVGPTNQTAFCYQIIVSNCDPAGGARSEPLVVTNIHDTLLTPLTGFETPFTLQPGESRTNYYKQSYAVGTHINSVSAIGFGQSSGVVTNSQASATATLVPISLTCALHLTNDFQVNTSPVNGCDVQLAANSINTAVKVILTIHNTGQGDLNVSVIGGSVLSTTPLVDCTTGAAITPPVVFVPAGQTVVTNIGCVRVSCPGATVSTVVQGSAVASGSVPCVYDAAGHVVTTAPSSCENCVVCLPPVPCISVSKGIACAPVTGAACDGTLSYLSTDTGVAGPTNQSAFCYQVIVSNCDTPGGSSSEPLVVTNIHDTLLAPLTGFETPFTLQPGESRTNYYKQSYAAGSHVNTVSAIGFGQSSGVVTNAHASATATVVPISLTCVLHLTNDFQVNTSPVNNCDVELAAGASNAAVKVILTIHNTGQGDLNVSVIGGTILSTTPLVDCATGASITPPVVFVPAGQTVVTNIGCVRVSCPGATVSAVVQGSAVASASIPCVHDAAGHVVTTAPSSCQNCVICVPSVPCIHVSKGITCAPVTGAACDGTLTYLSTDTGVAGPTNQSAFCYQIIVSNCDTPGASGSEPLIVSNIHDNLITPLTGFETPFTLLPGESRTNYYKQSYGVGTHTNTVTTVGSGLTSGTVTQTQARATAIVVPISVTCNLTLSSDFNLNTNNSGKCPVTLPAGSSNSPVSVTLTIHNTGHADLNVSIIGGSVMSGLVSCADDSTPVTLPVVFVAAGTSVTTNLGCVLVGCPGATLSAVVQGSAVASASVPCVYDTAGHVVTTAPSSCEACVNCAAPLTCRVTGGGTLVPNATDHNCITLTTTLFDDLQPAHVVLDHISHGGQLGAPFSHQDCGQILGDPCIRGQWQHNRHYQGTGNPHDQIDADFHSNTPKGVFDTLLCACLGCCSGGEFIGSAIANNLCNPDDHKICGPEPRPAPANAIIFTGIGTFKPQATDTKGRAAAARYVIFRVYIEDRSEPGGLHPGGAKEPADVYCFQAWDTGIATSKKPDFSEVAADFRRALAADSCAFIKSISTGAPTGLPPGSLPSSTVAGTTADIVDCGPLYDGNHQIHPSTGATCNSTTSAPALSSAQ